MSVQVVRSRRSVWMLLALVAAGASVTIPPGCGKKEKPQAEEPAGKSTKVEPKTQGGQSVAAASTQREKLWVDDNGVEWWGNHPLKVWHDDPLAVAADKRPVGTQVAKNGTTSPMNGGPKTPMNGTKDPPMTAAGGADDWKSIAPMPQIEAEIKRIRNNISQKMQTVGRYNGAYKEVSWNGTTLAALAMIIEQHPDKVSWKDDVKYVRDLGSAIQDAASGLGRKNYDAAQKPFENFVSILSRNKPTGLKDPEAATFVDRVDRGGAMRRMEMAADFIHKQVNNEEVFKAKKEDVLREATILAAMTKVISDQSYDSADEAEYKQYARNLVKAALEMVEAAKNDEFQKFRTASDTVQTQCNDCHTDYKG